MARRTTKKLKRLHHHLTKKKILKKHHAKHLARSFFTLVVLSCLASLSLAIASTRPQVDLQVRTNLAKAIAQINEPANQFPDQVGIASWYALGLPAPDDLTCASTKFGRGAYLLVRNLRNGRSVICRVNDYGPETWTGRAIDLSRGSFSIIDSLSAGTAPVNIWLVPPPPASFNLPLPASFGTYLGYNLCRQSHSPHYCDSHRRSSQ